MYRNNLNTKGYFGGVFISNNIYIKYPLKIHLIQEILLKTKRKKINFFIDLNSICKGFYNTETVLYEIGEYSANGEVSDKLIVELKFFLNNLYNEFKSFDPFFVIFYDTGRCLQNRLVLPSYKSGRSISTIGITEDAKQTEIFRKIRHYYYQKIVETFNKQDLCSVQFIPDYETDCVPHYCLRFNVFDAADNDILNIVMSVDKDLLQTCEFNNTIQCITSFKADKEKGKFKINFGLYDKLNAVSYIHEKFNPGILTAKHIPLILALAGDKSDEIPGIDGIGPVKAIKLIENNSIPATIHEIKQNINSMPKIIQNNLDIIIRNLKLISFDEQLKRLPRNFLK